MADDTPATTAIKRRAGRRFGRLLVTSTRQAGGHPWFDRAGTNDDDGNIYRSVAIRPSLRRQYDRPGGLAMVIGWQRAKPAAEPSVVVDDDEWAEAIVPVELSASQRERFEAAADRALAARRAALDSGSSRGESS